MQNNKTNNKKGLNKPHLTVVEESDYFYRDMEMFRSDLDQVSICDEITHDNNSSLEK